MQNYKELINRKNTPLPEENNIYTRYKYPIITAKHIPIHWRFDLNAESNPMGLERIGVNAAFNAGAIKWKDKYVLAVRIEGNDRKSFFGFAESPNGIDNFTFWDTPLLMPENEDQDVNVYDIRLTVHEDGYVYGVFCTERKDPSAPDGDTSSALANAGIIRSKDLKNWERLPNLKTASNQQRNVVLHSEFINGKYAFYTRPQDGFIETGAGGGIGVGFVKNIEVPEIEEETILNNKEYHTVYELKNGLGPAPIKTEKGWLHLAHGVRNTASGLRYVLYLFITDLNNISKITHIPGGYFMAPNSQEIVGDVSNVLFCNGWIADNDGTVYIYYASSDTRMHVATTTVDVLLDYCINTPPDGFESNKSVNNILQLIEKNKEVL
ncbi:glycoside hydrolase family 130 protein [Galbibacter mesophilus]|uniref:glycoside hydrolase family 130 protein n=1 Tax=Galbibacter mesophilus TaxID=379069 RepID=UPI00191E10F0|nr:glycosidase [Galbibacter mesophilus]MCM5663698.1 glycosidase [Galbibacter mesophilus]